MQDREARVRILEMVENGQISPQEAFRLMRVIETEPEEQQAEQVVQQAVTDVVPKTALEGELTGWKRWWQLPFWISVAVLVFGAGLVYWAFIVGGYTFWFFAAWLPFVIGLTGMVLSWQSQYSPWLYVRITQRQPGSPGKIAFAMPLPLSLGSWFLRNFTWAIPHMHQQNIGEMLQALEVSLHNNGEPMVIDVRDEEDGDHVEVYVG